MPCLQGNLLVGLSSLGLNHGQLSSVYSYFEEAHMTAFSTQNAAHAPLEFVCVCVSVIFLVVNTPFQHLAILV